MPQVNLSTLNGQELRQLLDASRRRGDASLSYSILQEMAARRERPAGRGPFMMLRPAEPRVVAVELDEPVKDELPPLPAWWPAREPEESASSAEPEAAPPPSPAHEASPAPAPRRSRRKTQPAPTLASAVAAAVAAVDVEPPPPAPLEAGRPLSLHDAWPQAPRREAEDAGDPELRLRPEKPQRLPPPPRNRLRGVAVFALGIAVGIAAGWWASGIARFAPPPAAPAAPAAVAIETAALAPPPAPASAPIPPSEAAPASETPPDQAVAAPPPDLRGGSASPPSAQEPAREPDSPATEPPPPPPAPRSAESARTAELALPAPERATPVVASGCASEPTPADREICGAPALRRLQRELQRAYAEALEAHEDRGLLRQHQLAWREARNTVTDPDRLARLYEERIRKLNAATAEARQQR